MKKISCILGILVLVLFASCSTPPSTTNIFDESIPLEKTTTLHIGAGWTVKAYNGIDVELEAPDIVIGIAFTGFTIPAGETELVMDLYWQETAGIGRTGSITTNYTADDVILQYNFEAGHEYYIQFMWINEDGKIPRVGGFGSKRALIISDSATKDPWTPVFFREMTFE